jgi:hypothetical protein
MSATPLEQLVEMTRRLVLVGIFVLIERGSILQLVIGCLFCAVYLCVHGLLVPAPPRPSKETRGGVASRLRRLLQMQVNPYLSIYGASLRLSTSECQPDARITSPPPVQTTSLRTAAPLRCSSSSSAAW